MNYITRQIEPTIHAAASEYPAVLLTGARQVGKTTVMRHILEAQNSDVEQLSLDDLDLRRLAKNDPALFFQLHEPPVFIDEVQYAPELFSQIKMMIDSGAQPGSFWLTGSQRFRLMELAGESLAGRIAILSMSSLSLREIQGSPQAGPLKLSLAGLKDRAASAAPMTAKALFAAIRKGSMPAVVNGSRSNLDLYYSGYVQTYIERDVRRLLGDVDAIMFSDFMRAAAARCAQVLNVSGIAEDVGIRPDKAKAWLAVLERSGVVFKLHPYSNNQLKRTVKAPKLYFDDCGLVAYLARWSTAETLEAGAMSGAFVENLVVSEICKSFLNEGHEPPVYYYRDRDAKEIDVVIVQDGQLHPLEVKKTAAPNLGMTSAFATLDRSALPRGTGAVVCMAERLSALDENTFVIPIWAL